MDHPDISETMYGYIATKNWGPWELDRESRSVVVRQPHEYWIPIDDLATDAGIAHWLLHVAEKTWATNEYLGGLVRACRALHDAPADPIWIRGKQESVGSGEENGQ
jgi:hypothetical protein